LFHLFIEKT